MYDELIRQFRDKAERNRIEGKPGLARDYTHAADAIGELWREVKKYRKQHSVIPAADAIEKLSMKLHGDEAAIAGMKREIERMVVAGKPRWIPVTERLPEKRKWVLCKCQANIVEVLRFENAEWYHDPAHVYMFEFVTHWMPLPEPPKEEA